MFSDKKIDEALKPLKNFSTSNTVCDWTCRHCDRNNQKLALNKPCRHCQKRN